MQGVSPPARVLVAVSVLSHESTCWSCLVIVDQGAKVCPFCGADQTLPAESVVLEPAKQASLTSVFLRWTLVTIGAACILGGVLWYALRNHATDSREQAEAIAAKALTEVRSALSEYALTAGDKYPSTLEPMGDRAAQPVQAARNEGYDVVYNPKPSEKDGTIVGFVLVARPGKPNYRSFYIDASGILRATQEDRPANDQDPPI